MAAFGRLLPVALPDSGHFGVRLLPDQRQAVVDPEQPFDLLHSGR